MKETATELEFLKWFYQNADFGPADEDIKEIMKDEFEQKTDKKLPRGY